MRNGCEWSRLRLQYPCSNNPIRPENPMFPALGLTLALLVPGAPIPKDVAPSGPAPYILNLKSENDGKVRFTVMRSVKAKVTRIQFQGGPNGQQVPVQVESEVTVQQHIRVELAELKDLKVYTPEGKDPGGERYSGLHQYRRQRSAPHRQAHHRVLRQRPQRRLRRYQLVPLCLSLSMRRRRCFCIRGRRGWSIGWGRRANSDNSFYCATESYNVQFARFISTISTCITC